MVTYTGLIFLTLTMVVLIFFFNRRIRNLITGKMDKAIDEAEKADPESVYRAEIKRLQKNIVEVQDLATEATGMVYQVQQGIHAKEDSIASLERDLKLAGAAGDKAVGAELILRIDALREDIVELKERATDYQANADETIGIREDLEKELSAIVDEAAQAKTLGKADIMYERINARKKGILTDDESKALQNARAATAGIRAKHKSEKTTAERSLEGKLAKLRAGAAQNEASDKFDAMFPKK